MKKCTLAERDPTFYRNKLSSQQMYNSVKVNTAVIPYCLQLFIGKFLTEYYISNE